MSADTLRRAWPGAVALLFLNAMLSFSTWWPTPGVVLDARIAPEFVLCWVLLLALVAWRGVPGPRALWFLAAAYLLLVLGRYVDVTAPALFGRAVNLYWDVPQLPRFLWVAAKEHPAWLVGSALALTALFIWAMHAALRRAIRIAARDAAPYALRARWTWALTAFALASAIANYAGVRATWPYVSKPVVPVYWKQVQLLVAASSPALLMQALPASTAIERALAAAPGRALAGLRGSDVYLVFLESIGAVIYDDPRAAQRIGPHRRQLARAVSETGRSMVSAFVRSPTIGGGSDLAHLSLLSGIDLSDPRRHDLLLTTTRPTLISLFRREGYRTFGLYAAVSWEWPERAYYGFDVYLEGRMLDYRGPALGPWYMPDQFSLARFEAMHPRTAGEPPRLVFFPTITSHLPFSPVPPYQPDWKRVLDPEPFDAGELARARAERVNWLDMFPDYLRMVEYAFRWLEGFLRLPEPRDTVYVLLGDHQPAANVAGEGQPWDVPVYVIARDRALLGRLEARGFAAGIDPPRSPLGGMHELTAVLLEAFGAPAVAQGESR